MILTFLMCLFCIVYIFFIIFFFKQKTAYEMRISDWSSDVCSSDLHVEVRSRRMPGERLHHIEDLEGTEAATRRVHGPFAPGRLAHGRFLSRRRSWRRGRADPIDRKSTRLNSSH